MAALSIGEATVGGRFDASSKGLPQVATCEWLGDPQYGCAWAHAVQVQVQSTSLGRWCTSRFQQHQISRQILSNDFRLGDAALPQYRFQLLTEAHLVSVQVVAVPEPAEWAMLLAGAGLVGSMVRSRRRA